MDGAFAETDGTSAWRKLRKRLQNRLNQRARRSRIREEKYQTKADVPPPYQVDRWRHTYTPFVLDTNASPMSIRAYELCSYEMSISLRDKSIDNSPRKTNTEKQNDAVCSTIISQPNHFNPSPTQDHLLHLIQTNVLRGFFDNKLALLASTNYFTKNDVDAELHVVPPEQVFPGRAAIMAIAKDLPESLHPTKLQKSVIHATCIDLIPFQAMRNNLIKNEGRFSWPALIEELVGHLVSPSCFICPFEPRKPSISYKGSLYCNDDMDDEFTANRHGVILWGAAHRPESWEFTPNFLRTWGWTLDGCKEIIEHSNRWRRSRGEEHLKWLA